MAEKRARIEKDEPQTRTTVRQQTEEHTAGNPPSSPPDRFRSPSTGATTGRGNLGPDLSSRATTGAPSGDNTAGRGRGDAGTYPSSRFSGLAASDTAGRGSPRTDVPSSSAVGAAPSSTAGRGNPRDDIPSSSAAGASASFTAAADIDKDKSDELPDLFPKTEVWHSTLNRPSTVGRGSTSSPGPAGRSPSPYQAHVSLGRDTVGRGNVRPNVPSSGAATAATTDKDKSDEKPNIWLKTDMPSSVGRGNPPSPPAPPEKTRSLPHTGAAPPRVMVAPGNVRPNEWPGRGSILPYMPVSGNIIRNLEYRRVRGSIGNWGWPPLLRQREPEPVQQHAASSSASSTAAESAKQAAVPGPSQRAAVSSSSRAAPAQQAGVSSLSSPSRTAPGQQPAVSASSSRAAQAQQAGVSSLSSPSKAALEQQPAVSASSSRETPAQQAGVSPLSSSSSAAPSQQAALSSSSRAAPSQQAAVSSSSMAAPSQQAAVSFASTTVPAQQTGVSQRTGHQNPKGTNIPKK